MTDAHPERRPLPTAKAVVFVHRPERSAGLPLWIVIVGWSQIIGGALACVAQFAPRVTSAQGLRIEAPIHMLFVGVASIVAGALLLSRHRWGVRASFGMQLLQVFAISGIAHWVFATGAAFRMLVSPVGMGLQVDIGGQYYSSMTSPAGLLPAHGFYVTGGATFNTPFESAEWIVGINFVAIYFARRLWRLMRGIEERARVRIRDREVEDRSALIARQREAAQPQFDIDARRVHERALDEAELLQHQFIGPEHLLLAVLRDNDNEGARAIRSLNVDVDAMMNELASALPPGKPKFNPHRLYPHTSRAALVLRFAVEGAASQGLVNATPAHILLALLREGRSLAAKILVNHGVNEAALRSALAALESPDSTPPSNSEH